MFKFNYSFQRILDIKEKEKETAQLQMAKAIQRQERTEIKLNQVFTELEEEEQRLYGKQQQGVSITELRFRENYVDYLRKKASVEKEALIVANKNVDIKQDLLQDKLKEEKIWSIHKEKKVLEFLDGLKKEEQIHLDELSSQRYHHQLGLRGEEVGRK